MHHFQRPGHPFLTTLIWFVPLSLQFRRFSSSPRDSHLLYSGLQVCSPPEVTWQANLYLSKCLIERRHWYNIHSYKQNSNQTSATVLNVSLSTGRTCFSSIFDLLTVRTSVISFAFLCPLPLLPPSYNPPSGVSTITRHRERGQNVNPLPAHEHHSLTLPLPSQVKARTAHKSSSQDRAAWPKHHGAETDWAQKKRKNVQARWCKWSQCPGTLNWMKQQCLIRLMEGTQVRYRWGLKMCSFVEQDFKPHEGGRQSSSRDPTGNKEWKEGSHLQNHNRADYLWGAERKHTQKHPSAVMSPPAVRSLSPFEIKLRFLTSGPEQHAQHSDIRQQHDSGQLCHSLARVPLGT